MIDVFISYKREERAAAERVATALAEAGYQVWWDVELIAGQRFWREIEAVLDQAKAVVILFSERARQSAAIEAEASRAFGLGKHVPCFLDSKANVPFPMNATQAQDLTDLDDPARIEALVAAVREKAGAPKAAAGAETVQNRLSTGMAEAMVWTDIRESREAGDFEFYLRRYGDQGMFADLAREKIAELRPEKPAPAAEERAAGPDAHSSELRMETRPRWGALLVAAALGAVLAAAVFWLAGPGGSDPRSLEREVDAQMRRADAAEAQVAELEQAYARTEDELRAAANARVEELTNEINMLTRRLEEAQAAAGDGGAEVSEIRTRLEEVESELSRTTARLADLQRERDAYRERYETLRKDIIGTESQLKSEQVRNARFIRCIQRLSSMNKVPDRVPAADMDTYCRSLVGN